MLEISSPQNVPFRQCWEKILVNPENKFENRYGEFSINPPLGGLREKNQ
jgi:hypothetical protein